MMLVSLSLVIPTTAQASEKRNFVAVIVDDSKSMSYYNEVGSDPAGLAAFAASQLPRFVPDGTTLGIFTFDSTATKDQQTREAKVAQPLHVIKNINDSVRQRSFDILSAALLKQNPEGFHPYGFGGTPCRDALIAASEWLATETGTDDAIARTVLFLSDGVCDGDQALKQSLVYNRLRANKALGPTALHCVGFGKDGTTAKARSQFKACDGRDFVAGPAGSGAAVVGDEEAQGLLQLLKSFASRLDAAKGQQTTWFVSDNEALRAMPVNFNQATSISLIVAELCEDPATCEDARPLKTADNPNTTSRIDGVTRETWRWPDGKNKKGEVAGPPIARFKTAYVSLTPALYRQLRGGDNGSGLDLSDKNRTAIFRPQYNFSADVKTYNGECSGARNAAAPEAEFIGVSNKKKICVEARLLAGGSHIERDLATYATLKRAYEGGDAAPNDKSLPDGNLKAWFADVGVKNGVSEEVSKVPPSEGVTTNFNFQNAGPTWRKTLIVEPCEVGPDGAIVKQSRDIHFMVRARTKAGIPWDKAPMAFHANVNACFGGEDADNDGSPSRLDCDDNDPRKFPGNDEVCDGIDNNCNGDVDEGDHLKGQKDPKTGKCYTDCVWGMAQSPVEAVDGAFEGLKQDNEGLVLDFGRPMGEAKVERVIRFNDDTRLACAKDRVKASIALKLVTVGKDKGDSLNTECYTLSGHLEDDGTPKIWKFTDSGTSPIRLKLERKPLCAVLGEPGGAPTAYDKEVALVVDWEKSQGITKDQLTSEEVAFTMRAHFLQSLSVKAVSGQTNLDLYDPESMLKFDVTPRLDMPSDTGATMVTIDPKNDLDMRLLKHQVLRARSEDQEGFQREDACGKPDADPESCMTSELQWINCDSQTELSEVIDLPVKPCTEDSGCGAGNRCVIEEGASTGNCAAQVCLKMVGAASCAGGGLFRFCNCINTESEELCHKVQMDSEEPLRVGLAGLKVSVKGGPTFTSYPTDANGKKADFTLSDEARLDNVSFSAERGFMDWFSPGSGPGWWWIVILLHVIWITGMLRTQSRTFAKMGASQNKLRAMAFIVLVWMATGAVHFLSSGLE